MVSVDVKAPCLLTYVSELYCIVAVNYYVFGVHAVHIDWGFRAFSW